MPAKCGVENCLQAVTKEGHLWCLTHWKAEKNGGLRKCKSCGKWFEMKTDACDACAEALLDEESQAKTSGMLNSTRLGDHFKVPSRRANLLLAELGWIEKYVKGWRITDAGKKVGGIQREIRQTGVPYVVWPAGIVNNKSLVDTMKESQGEVQPISSKVSVAAVSPSVPVSESGSHSGFRDRFPANHRATDGHLVRSRAEMLIDNWLYMQQIVHAVERKLPVEEEVYCDFYLPVGKVYIEYWGLEKDPKYAARMQEKKAIYEKYKMNLVELNDADIMNLDDVLPRLLLKYSIDCT